MSTDLGLSLKVVDESKYSWELGARKFMAGDLITGDQVGGGGSVRSVSYLN